MLLSPAQRQTTADSNYFERSISSSISTDIRYVKEFLVRFLGGIPREFLQFLFLTLTLFLLSSTLFSVFLFGVFPAMFLVRKLGMKLKKRVSNALENYSILTEWLQQRLLGIETIKHYSTEAFESNNMKQSLIKGIL